MAAMAWVLAMLAGCYMPAHKAHAALAVAADGTLAFGGQPVAADALQAAVAARVRAEPSLVVEISASPQADLARVRVAVAAVRAAHAQVAFAGATPAQ